MRVKRRFADLPMTQIHYREAGSGECLLLIHEMPLSSDVFEPLMQRMGEEIHLIAPDLPGNGDSEPLQDKISMEQYAKILLDFMKHINIQRFSIFGVHAGASVAIEMAHQAPERVSKLILSGVPLFTEEERVHLHRNLKDFQYEDTGTHFQEWWDFFQNKWDNQTSKVIIQRAVMNVMKAGPHYDWGYREAFDYDPTDALKQLKHPVFLLVAEQDPLIGKNAAVLKMLPQAIEKVIHVPQHISQAATEETANYALNFLNIKKTGGILS